MKAAIKPRGKLWLAKSVSALDHFNIETSPDKQPLPEDRGPCKILPKRWIARYAQNLRQQQQTA